MAQRAAELQEQLIQAKAELQGRRRHKAFERLLTAGKTLELNINVIECAIASISKMSLKSDEDEASFNASFPWTAGEGVFETKGTQAEAAAQGADAKSAGKYVNIEEISKKFDAMELRQSMESDGNSTPMSFPSLASDHKFQLLGIQEGSKEVYTEEVKQPV